MSNFVTLFKCLEKLFLYFCTGYSYQVDMALLMQIFILII